MENFGLDFAEDGMVFVPNEIFGESFRVLPREASMGERARVVGRR